MATTTQAGPQFHDSQATANPAQRSSSTQAFSPCLIPLLGALPTPTAEPLPNPRPTTRHIDNPDSQSVDLAAGPAADRCADSVLREAR
jgi:hypothetical protein